MVNPNQIVGRILGDKSKNKKIDFTCDECGSNVGVKIISQDSNIGTITRILCKDCINKIIKKQKYGDD